MVRPAAHLCLTPCPPQQHFACTQVTKGAVLGLITCIMVAFYAVVAVLVLQPVYIGIIVLVTVQVVLAIAVLQLRRRSAVSI